MPTEAKKYLWLLIGSFIAGASLVLAIVAGGISYLSYVESVKANAETKLNNRLIEIAMLIQMEPPQQQQSLVAKAKGVK